MSSQLDPSHQRLAWIRQWQTSAPMLRAQARNELRNLTLAARQKQIADLLDLAHRMRKVRIDDGLVEMKRRLEIQFGQQRNELDVQ